MSRAIVPVAPLVPAESRFRFLRLAPDARRALVGNTGTFDEHCASYFTGDGLIDRFARALGARRAVRVKELLESIEFFGVARRRVRASSVADLCASHGLVGAMYALFERSVERVLLVDRSVPESRAEVLAAAHEVGPWTVEKLVPHDGLLARRGAELAPGTALVAVHACGFLTDEVIELAVRLGGPVGLLPCCRPHRRSPAPTVLARELGAETAFDVDRTYRLENAGFTARWDAVPASITPMNRVILAWPRAR
ncbi:MAG: hypothetical protein R3F49_12055 [Planctomycetota bacterium]